jgi:hypothetical protein
MADYTTLARFKQELHIDPNSVADDTLISLLITAASRAWDRKCTGVVDPDSNNYFTTATVTNEILRGQIDYDGNIIVYPHKPIITAIQSFAFQKNVTTSFYSVSGNRFEIDGYKVRAYPNSMPLDYPDKCRVVMGYTGGLGAVVTDFPDDMQEAVAILAARFYREAETGLSDQIGVAELSTMVYTKAWPARVLDVVQVYKRRQGWHHVA